MVLVRYNGTVTQNTNTVQHCPLEEQHKIQEQMRREGEEESMDSETAVIEEMY